ncbi:hypothetical protein GCM10010250_65590 [Streptomyces althioticus]|nr:hypothetical protein GCM10010250_65590 [Streptomyces althioticus]
MACLQHSRHTPSSFSTDTCAQTTQAADWVYVLIHEAQALHRQAPCRVAPHARQLVHESGGGTAEGWQRTHSPEAK